MAEIKCGLISCVHNHNASCAMRTPTILDANGICTSVCFTHVCEDCRRYAKCTLSGKTDDRRVVCDRYEPAQNSDTRRKAP